MILQKQQHYLLKQVQMLELIYLQMIIVILLQVNHYFMKIDVLVKLFML